MNEALNKIGTLIKNRRTELGLSVKDLSEKSRVGFSNIVNIEEGIRDELPEDACLNGFLKILLKTLKFDNYEKILIDYNLARESQEFINLSNSGRHINKFPEKNVLQSKLDSKKLIYILLAFIFLVTLSNSILQNASRTKNEKLDKASTSSQKALTEQAKKLAKKKEINLKEEAEAAKSLDENENLDEPEQAKPQTGFKKLSIKVNDTAWLQVVSADTGKVIFEGDVKSGTPLLEFSDAKGFVLSSGNAGALEVSTDGTEARLIGKKDQLVKWYYPDSAKEAYLKKREQKSDE